MREIPNEELYLELRKQHRRLMAEVGLISVQIFGTALFYLVYGLQPALYFILIVSAIVTISTILWCRASYGSERSRRILRFARLVTHPVEWESDVEDEIGLSGGSGHE